jgi:hypothetical protein
MNLPLRAIEQLKKNKTLFYPIVLMDHARHFDGEKAVAIYSLVPRTENR